MGWGFAREILLFESFVVVVVLFCIFSFHKVCRVVND